MTCKGGWYTFFYEVIWKHAHQFADFCAKLAVTKRAGYALPESTINMTVWWAEQSVTCGQLSVSSEQQTSTTVITQPSVKRCLSLEATVTPVPAIALPWILRLCLLSLRWPWTVNRASVTTRDNRTRSNSNFSLLSGHSLIKLQHCDVSTNIGDRNKIISAHKPVQSWIACIGYSPFVCPDCWYLLQLGRWNVTLVELLIVPDQWSIFRKTIFSLLWKFTHPTWKYSIITSNVMHPLHSDMQLSKM